MAADSNSGIIEKKVLIQATPQVIFKALTDAKDLAQWFCDRASSDPRVGGEIKAYWRGGIGCQPQRGRAIFTKLAADAQVELLWTDDGSAGNREGCRHVLSYTIRVKRGTSEVQVRDDGPPFADEEVEQVLSRGWISVLRDLKEHCEAKQRSTRRHSADEPETK
jgi:uncharacterized protein YndB with AHSA1/START domain